MNAVRTQEQVNYSIKQRFRNLGYEYCRIQRLAKEVEDYKQKDNIQKCVLDSKIMELEQARLNAKTIMLRMGEDMKELSYLQRNHMD